MEIKHPEIKSIYDQVKNIDYLIDVIKNSLDPTIKHMHNYITENKLCDSIPLLNPINDGKCCVLGKLEYIKDGLSQEIILKIVDINYGCKRSKTTP